MSKKLKTDMDSYKLTQEQLDFSSSNLLFYLLKFL